MADDNKRPPRVQLIRIDKPDDRIEALYNPGEFTETFGAEWARIKVQGLSHSVKQFSLSKDRTFKVSFTFVVMSFGRPGLLKLLDARKKLLSWSRPRNVISTINVAGAPRVLFLWPNFISTQVVVDSVNWKYTRFNSSMEPVEASVELGLEEIRDTLVTADEDEDPDALSVQDLA